MTYIKKYWRGSEVNYVNIKDKDLAEIYKLCIDYWRWDVLYELKRKILLVGICLN